MTSVVLVSYKIEQPHSVITETTSQILVIVTDSKAPKWKVELVSHIFR
jgi:hypothetical protein